VSADGRQPARSSTTLSYRRYTFRVASNTTASGTTSVTPGNFHGSFRASNHTKWFHPCCVLRCLVPVLFCRSVCDMGSQSRRPPSRCPRPSRSASRVRTTRHSASRVRVDLALPPPGSGRTVAYPNTDPGSRPHGTVAALRRAQVLVEGLDFSRSARFGRDSAVLAPIARGPKA